MSDSRTKDRRRATVVARWVLFFFALSIALGFSLLYKLTRPATYRDDSPEAGATARVAKVYDGDTFRLQNGKKVRLIGVDTLDAHNRERMLEQARHLGMARRDIRKWASRATNWLQKAILHRPVTLRYGPEKEDDYGRLLAYVECQKNSSTMDVNRRLIEKGLATATRIFPHPRLQEFIQCERKARRNQKGLWNDASGHYQ